MKYEEVYFDREQRMIKALDILKIHDHQKQLFESFYRDHLWCPDCKQVQIGVVVSGGVHLRGYRTQEHLDGCEHKQPVYIVSDVHTIKDSPAAMHKARHQMDLLLRRTYTQPIGTVHRRKNSKPISSSNNSSPLHGNFRPDYRLPQKRIDLALEPEDFEFPKIFYGLVRTRWNLLKRYLWLCNAKGDRLCGIKISEKIEPYLLNDGIPLHSSPAAHIAFFGQLNAFKDGTPWCDLHTSQYLRIEYSDPDAL